MQDGEVVSGVVDTALCSLVASRLQSITPCGLDVSDVNVSACGQALAAETCPFWATCRHSSAHSFHFQGGSVTASTCQVNPVRVGIGGGVLLVVLIIALVVTYKLLTRATTQKLKAYHAQADALRKAATHF